LKRTTTRIAVAAAAVFASYALAQSSTFEARLSPAPVDARTQASTTGRGQATAALDGRRLVLQGTFEGLKEPATAAHLHLSPALGVRGPAVYGLNVSEAVAGTVGGSIELSARHVEALEAGLLYVQIDGKSTPEGNLWGWLLH
jgi:hypothetical protein